MLVNICAIWNSSWKDYGVASTVYEVPDGQYRYDDDVLALFGRIARDFAEQTDDEYALDQIECGFDWGIFMDCVDNEFLGRYGVKKLTPEARNITCQYDTTVTNY